MLSPSVRALRPGRAVLAATTVATSAMILVVAAPATPAGAVQVPGDRQSPAAAAAADLALDAYAVFERQPSWFNQQRFETELTATATITASEVGVSPEAMSAAWLSADESHRVALLTGVSLLGTSYTDNGDDPDEGFDCSGFTSYSWRNAGVELPRSSGDQISAADEREPESAMAGDLVQYPGHVMMYLGVGDSVVHSSNEENDVELYVLPSDRSYAWADPSN